MGLLNKLASRIAKKRRGPDSEPLPAPSLWLLTQGLLHGVAGYCFLARVWVARSMRFCRIRQSGTPITLAIVFAAVSLSYVAGFVFLVSPGGIGAREFVLAVALTPPFSLGLEREAAAGMAIVVALGASTHLDSRGITARLASLREETEATADFSHASNSDSPRDAAR